MDPTRSEAQLSGAATTLASPRDVRSPSSTSEVYPTASSKRAARRRESSGFTSPWHHEGDGSRGSSTDSALVGGGHGGGIGVGGGSHTLIGEHRAALRVGPALRPAPPNTFTLVQSSATSARRNSPIDPISSRGMSISSITSSSSSGSLGSLPQHQQHPQPQPHRRPSSVRTAPHSGDDAFALGASDTKMTASMSASSSSSSSSARYSPPSLSPRRENGWSMLPSAPPPLGRSEGPPPCEPTTVAATMASGSGVGGGSSGGGGAASLRRPSIEQWGRNDSNDSETSTATSHASSTFSEASLDSTNTVTTEWFSPPALDSPKALPQSPTLGGAPPGGAATNADATTTTTVRHRAPSLLSAPNVVVFAQPDWGAKSVTATRSSPGASPGVATSPSDGAAVAADVEPTQHHRFSFGATTSHGHAGGCADGRVSPLNTTRPGGADPLDGAAASHEQVQSPSLDAVHSDADADAAPSPKTEIGGSWGHADLSDATAGFAPRASWPGGAPGGGPTTPPSPRSSAQPQRLTPSPPIALPAIDELAMDSVGSDTPRMAPTVALTSTTERRRSSLGLSFGNAEEASLADQIDAQKTGMMISTTMTTSGQADAIGEASDDDETDVYRPPDPLPPPMPVPPSPSRPTSRSSPLDRAATSSSKGSWRLPPSLSHQPSYSSLASAHGGGAVASSSTAEATTVSSSRGGSTGEAGLARRSSTHHQHHHLPSNAIAARRSSIFTLYSAHGTPPSSRPASRRGSLVVVSAPNPTAADVAVLTPATTLGISTTTSPTLPTAAPRRPIFSLDEYHQHHHHHDDTDPDQIARHLFFPSFRPNADAAPTSVHGEKPPRRRGDDEAQRRGAGATAERQSLAQQRRSSVPANQHSELQRAASARLARLASSAAAAEATPTSRRTSTHHAQQQQQQQQQQLRRNDSTSTEGTYRAMLLEADMAPGDSGDGQSRHDVSTLSAPAVGATADGDGGTEGEVDVGTDPVEFWSRGGQGGRTSSNAPPSSLQPLPEAVEPDVRRRSPSPHHHRHAHPSPPPPPPQRTPSDTPGSGVDAGAETLLLASARSSRRLALAQPSLDPTAKTWDEHQGRGGERSESPGSVGLAGSTDKLLRGQTREFATSSDVDTAPRRRLSSAVLLGETKAWSTRGTKAWDGADSRTIFQNPWRATARLGDDTGAATAADAATPAGACPSPFSSLSRGKARRPQLDDSLRAWIASTQGFESRSRTARADDEAGSSPRAGAAMLADEGAPS